MSDEIVRRFVGYKPNPTIREVAARQDEGSEPRNLIRDACVALVPGDDPSGHPFHDPNPWLGKLPSTIKAAIVAGLSGGDLERAERALLVIGRLEGGGQSLADPFEEPSCGRPSPIKFVGG